MCAPFSKKLIVLKMDANITVRDMLPVRGFNSFNHNLAIQ